MRYLVQLQFPHEPFNKLVREGTIGAKIGQILEETHPESIYFTEVDGRRGAVAVYDVKRDSDVPRVAEPWFLTFQCDFRARVAMTPEELQKSNLEELGKRYR